MLSIAARCSALTFAFALAALPGCGSSTSDSTTHDDRDAGFDSGTTPADGGGVCCPIGPNFCCGAGGGWAPDPSGCKPGPCDGMLYLGTDAHGCAYVGSGVGPSSVCCGCPPDGGVEAGEE